MANIVLKDKSGNPVSHGDKRYFDVPDSSGELNSFMRTSNISCYYATVEEDSSGESVFTIRGQYFAVGTDRAVYSSVTDAVCKEYGRLNDNTEQYYLFVRQVFRHPYS